MSDAIAKAAHFAALQRKLLCEEPPHALQKRSQQVWLCRRNATRSTATLTAIRWPITASGMMDATAGVHVHSGPGEHGGVAARAARAPVRPDAVHRGADV